MFAPDIGAGVEETGQYSGLWILAGEIAGFVQIAVIAGEAEVIEFIIAAMLTRTDMLNVEQRERRYLLRQVAILASITGAPADFRSHGLVHYLSS
jgi:hypothetical protein